MIKYVVAYLEPQTHCPGDGAKTIGSFDTLELAIEFAKSEMVRLGGNWRERHFNDTMHWQKFDIIGPADVPGIPVMLVSGYQSIFVAQENENE